MLTLIVLSLIAIAIALGYGYFASLSFEYSPTLGDVIRVTARSSGIYAALFIIFIWWVAG